MAGALALAGFLAAPGVRAAGLADPLERPALMSPLSARAVLLDVVRTGSRLVAVGERGIILLSDDEGGHWRQARVPVSVSLTAVAFASPQVGWVVGHDGVILATADGGEHWRLQLDGRQAAAAIASGLDQAAAQRWLREGADKPFLAIRVDAAGTVWAIGAYGMAFRSADRGAHWEYFGNKLANPRGNHLYAIAIRDGNILIAGEQGVLFGSSDAGASFVRIDFPYKGTIFHLVQTPKGVFASGMNGKLFYAADDGRAWQPVSDPTPATLMAGALGPNGRVLWLNQAGQLLSGADGTEPLVPLTAGPLPGAICFVPGAGGSLVAVGFRGAEKLPAADTQRNQK
jgi:photosystem II stability/assembly factor-like uncharacterized protein